MRSLSRTAPKQELGDVTNDANTVVSGWWHDEELAPCPRCGDRRLTPPSPSLEGRRVCLTCGVLAAGESQ
jgi:hypothetical protein